MIKNIIIAGLATALFFSITGMAEVGVVGFGFSMVCMFALFLWLVADTEETIRSHMKYRKRRAFRSLLRKTKIERRYGA